MRKDPFNRLCLGTAQFGPDYGVANKGGKGAREESLAILESAFNAGVNMIDTAYAYGESEEIVGDFTEGHAGGVRIVTKLPPLDGTGDPEIEKIVKESLSRLKRKSIYGYLVHRFEDYLKYPSLWDVMEGLKKRGFMQKTGFSIYETNELEMILGRRIFPDILQLPYSVFDRRFEELFPMLKESGMEIHARSTFLQGLVFLEPDELKGTLLKAGDHIRALKEMSLRNGIPVNALCLNFSLLNPHIDRVIIGVDNLRHLESDLESIKSAETVKIKSVFSELRALDIRDEEIILPYKWKLT